MRVVRLLRKYDPAQWGGTETAMQRLLEGLRVHGVRSAIYCPALDSVPGRDPLRDAGGEVQRFRAFLPVLGISAQTRRQLVSVGGNLMSFDLISLLRRETDMSVLHAHALGRIGGIGLSIARQRNIPFVVTIHGGVLDLPPQLKKEMRKRAGGWEWGRFFGWIFQSHRLFPDADAILTCNGVEAALLREKYPGKRILVQPHGVPVGAYEEQHGGCALGAFPQIRGRRVLLCVGRIDPVKNQAWLVERLPRILQSHPDALLVLTGACTDEVYGEALRRRMRALGVENAVLFTGGLPPNDPRLIGLMQQAEAVLVPSISETFGLVILEAWAAGTTVLSSRTSGGRTLIRHGENGWLFDLDDPDGFHETLDRALHRSDRVRDVRLCGMDTVRTEYDVVALAGRMKRLYEELIEEKHALRHSTRR